MRHTITLHPSCVAVSPCQRAQTNHECAGRLSLGILPRALGGLLWDLLCAGRPGLPSESRSRRSGRLHHKQYSSTANRDLDSPIAFRPHLEPGLSVCLFPFDVIYVGSYFFTFWKKTLSLESCVAAVKDPKVSTSLGRRHIAEVRQSVLWWLSPWQGGWIQYTVPSHLGSLRVIQVHVGISRPRQWLNEVEVIGLWREATPSCSPRSPRRAAPPFHGSTLGGVRTNGSDYTAYK